MHAGQIKHNRIIDIRQKILAGWNRERLMLYITNMGVSDQTADRYIEEAVEPLRKIHEENQK